MAGTSKHIRPQSTSHQATTAVLVPVKTFEQAKARLADALTGAERARLARLVAERVLAAAQPLRTYVVCDDDNVRSWASDLGAETITPPSPGLNTAVAFGFAELRRLGYRSVIIAHADLPMATDLGWVGDFPGLSIVTDRHGDGTNVMSLPTSTEFDFHYGIGSGHQHRLEGLRRNLPVRWIRDGALGHDVDTPTDLDLLDGDIRRHLVGNNTPIGSQPGKGTTR